MTPIDPDTAKRRPPDVQIVFVEGDYSHALKCSYAARAWAVETGQPFRHDIYGIINRPHHPECPAGERMDEDYTKRPCSLCAGSLPPGEQC
jgi:hypothetical protein